MLEPLSPNHIPEKLPEVNDDSKLKAAEQAGDSEGFSFRFFGRSKKKKQSKKNSASSSSSVYNESNAVNLELSPEAQEKLQRQRDLKNKRKNQDQE